MIGNFEFESNLPLLKLDLEGHLEFVFIQNKSPVKHRMHEVIYLLKGWELITGSIEL